jgi:hypothetical protein
MPSRYVLSIMYIRNSLCVERVFMQLIYREFPLFAKPLSMDFNLGSDESHSNPDEDYYWQAVKDTIWGGSFKL